jgi:hypothetical protein
MSNPTEPNDSRQPDQVALSSGPGAEKIAAAVEIAALALADAYDLDGNCMQRVVHRALVIWAERLNGASEANP